MNSLLNTFAPPFRLVGTYFCVGLGFMILSVVGFYKADFSAVFSMQTAAFFHLFLAGGVMAIILGALYQLSSVILERPFFTLKGSILSAIFYVCGLMILTLGLAFEHGVSLLTGGAIFATSLLYFCFCFLASFFGRETKIKTTVNNAKTRKFAKLNFPVICLFLAGLYLLFGMIMGLMLVMIMSGYFNANFDLLLAHHIYFVVGAIFFTILGAGSVLLPMFSLAHGLSLLPAKIAVIMYILAIFWSEFTAQIAFIAFVFGASEFLYVLFKRVRRSLDYWNLNIFFAIFCLILGVAGYFFDRLDFSVYCFTYGFLFAFIAAHLYKIAPFLIWYHYVAPFVGKTKVPTLEQMIIKKLAYIALGVNFAGIICAIFSREFAAIFAFISVILVATNVINTFKFTKFGEK